MQPSGVGKNRHESTARRRQRVRTFRTVPRWAVTLRIPERVCAVAIRARAVETRGRAVARRPRAVETRVRARLRARWRADERRARAGAPRERVAGTVIRATRAARAPESQRRGITESTELTPTLLHFRAMKRYGLQVPSCSRMM